jgi:hypothetical protein
LPRTAVARSPSFGNIVMECVVDMAWHIRRPPHCRFPPRARRWCRAGPPPAFAANLFSLGGACICRCSTGKPARSTACSAALRREARVVVAVNIDGVSFVDQPSCSRHPNAQR